MWWRIVNADNFDGDYPNEKFVENLPAFTREADAQTVADAINSRLPDNAPRYFKVVPNDYKLKPGFEP